jgi:aminoglycoside phosphotransferase (APT) family kinase protein
VTADPRCRPLLELDRARIDAMLAPVLDGRRIRRISRRDDGLVKTVYRVALDDHQSLALSVWAGASGSIQQEQHLLERLRDILPVPAVLWVDALGSLSGHPYVVYRWIDGVTLNEYRRRAATHAWLTLAGPLGRMLALMSAVSTDGISLPGAEHPGRQTIACALDHARAALPVVRARGRLPAEAAQRLEDLFTEHEPLLCQADGKVLTHGDFGGRNILVKVDGPGASGIAGLIDWESSHRGAAFWDIGSLFRYSRRYGPAFRAAFASGYCATAGNRLPGHWWLTARLLDATRIVGILADDRSLPTVFGECARLVEELVYDFDEGREANSCS